jgi:hypothetical protein
MKKNLLNRVFGFLAFSLNALWLAAQGQGVAGITQATTELKTYFEPASNLILAIGAIVGLIGGVRCYIKWNTGDQDVINSVIGWGGACIFLVVVALVIRAFFL